MNVDISSLHGEGRLLPMRHERDHPMFSCIALESENWKLVSECNWLDHQPKSRFKTVFSMQGERIGGASILQDKCRGGGYFTMFLLLTVQVRTNGCHDYLSRYKMDRTNPRPVSIFFRIVQKLYNAHCNEVSVVLLQSKSLLRRIWHPCLSRSAIDRFDTVSVSMNNDFYVKLNTV